MTIERTLSIIKPDAVAKNLIGEIYRRFEQASIIVVPISASMTTPSGQISSWGNILILGIITLCSR